MAAAAYDEEQVAKARAASPPPTAWSFSAASTSDLYNQKDLPTDPCVALADLLLCRCMCSGGGERLGRRKMIPLSMPKHLMMGISVDGLREWVDENVTATENGRAPNGYDAQHHANLQALEDNLSVCERMSKAWCCSNDSGQVSEANVYVCWPLSAPLSCLLEGLESFLTTQTDEKGGTRDRDRTFFWICTFSLRAHVPPDGWGALGGRCPPYSPEPSQEHLLYLEGCGLLIELIGHTIVLLDSWIRPAALYRTHCLREIALSDERSAKVDLVMATSSRLRFEHAFARDFSPVCELLDAMSGIDLWQSECQDARDKRYVLKEATRSAYGKGLGREAVNEQLQTMLRNALIRLGRAALARLPMEDRPQSLIVGHLGATIKEIEVAKNREKLGDAHPTTLSSINQLAGVHKANGDLALAEPLYHECLNTRREVLGNIDRLTLTSINNLGTCLVALGDYDAAEVLLTEAVASRRRELGAIDPATLNSLHNLGNMHRSRGDFPKAAAVLEQALAGRRLAFGSKHVDTLRSLNTLGSALYDKGIHEPEKLRLESLDAAKALFAEALRTSRQTLGDQHPLTVTSLNNLGNLLHARALLQPKFIAGRGLNPKREAMMQESASLLREAMEASKSTLGSRHLETLISSSNLGSALRSLGGLGGDPAANVEAQELIRTAVTGIADTWLELERRPRDQAKVREGLEQLGEDLPSLTGFTLAKY